MEIYTPCHRRLRLHQYRRNKFRGVFDEKVAEMLPDYSSPPDAGPDVEVLNSLLAKLPSKQRESMVLFELSGFSLGEIRQMQGGTLSGGKKPTQTGSGTIADLVAGFVGSHRRDGSQHVCLIR